MGCPHCGAEDTTDGTGICIQCGKPLSPSDTDATRLFVAPPSSDFDLTRLPDASPAGTAPSGPDDATYLLPEARARKSDTRVPTPRSGPLAVGQRFGPRYRIVKLLGMGGMGAVYQAWDADLDVLVALKVIRAEVGKDPDETRAIERRFKQELLLARQVTHKNVVRIHDLGEIDGIKYITMSYIEGEDLASVLKREGQLPVPRAIRILRQVVSGLVAAHEAGVVHRDLKPANIMIEGEHAIIMDFGIARSSSPQSGMTAPTATDAAGGYRTGRHTQQSTMAGAIVGTIAYMAPEQARGDVVDQRADVYAMGLIASDLLVGPRKRPQQTLEDLCRDSDDPPMPLRLIQPDLPEALEAVVLRCLQRHPARRYQTTAELLAALNRLDDQGKKLPAIRRVTRRMVAATAVLGLMLLAATFYVTRIVTVPPVQPDPVSVIIADLDNRTGDPALNGTLEPMLRRALEGAGFISAYDRNGIVRTLGVRPPERLDEMGAREIAVQEGVGVVLSGSVVRDGDGYTIAVKATRTNTGEVLADADTEAESKETIVEAATELMTTVRTALGDQASESAQMLAMASLSATSFDVVRHYATAQEASSNGRFEEARADLLKAVEVDPEFGIGYHLLAVLSRNLGQLQEADKYINEALQYLDGMTERERYSTRGMYYRLTGDYGQCVKEYGELIARYAADVVGHNERAVCLSQLRDTRGAVDEMRQVVKLLPNRAMFRDNLALYANYAGDFQTAEKEASAIQEADAYTSLALAFAQVGQGRLPEALQTYQKLATIDALGASFAASGLGDLAAVEGRYADAVRILNEGAARDLSAKNTDRAASKLAAVAYAELSRGRTTAAVAAVDKALANSQAVKIRFLGARNYVEAGQIDKARPVMASLAAEVQAEPQAYAKVIEGDIALKSGDARLAIKLLSEANMLLDTWIGHYDLGRAYLDAGAFLQADSEFDRCLRRRGEALALFLDEEPTYAYLPSAYYYQGRVRDGLKIAGAAESYRNYLVFRGESRDDPLLADARQRAAQ